MRLSNRASKPYFNCALTSGSVNFKWPNSSITAVLIPSFVSTLKRWRVMTPSRVRSFSAETFINCPRILSVSSCTSAPRSALSRPTREFKSPRSNGRSRKSCERGLRPGRDTPPICPVLSSTIKLFKTSSTPSRRTESFNVSLPDTSPRCS